MCLIEELTYQIDRDHEVRAQYPNPVGTPQHHRIKKLRFKISKPSLDEAEGNKKMAKSVEGKKAVAAKAAEPKKVAKKVEKTTWGTAEVAKQLGVDPKYFRTVLRANNMGSDGKRYEWPIGDKLVKERKLITDYQNKAEERAAARAEKEEAEKTKKAEKKEDKKTAKAGKKASAANGKVKKAKPVDEEEEEVEPDEEEMEEAEEL